MIASLRRTLLLAAISIGLLMVACMIMGTEESAATESTPSTGGTGSEVVGAVDFPESGGAAKMLRTGGTRFLPIAGGSVFINWRRFLPDTAEAREVPFTITDSSGGFRIRYALPGEQLIYIRDNSGNSIAHAFTVPEGGAPVNLGTLHAQKTAGVSFQYSGKTPGDPLFVVNVLGTGMQLRCSNRDQRITFDLIPTGVDQILYIRIYRPINKKYELKPITLQPGGISTLQSIIGD